MQAIVACKSSCFRPWEQLEQLFNEKVSGAIGKILKALIVPERKLSGLSNLIQVVSTEQQEQNTAGGRSRGGKAETPRSLGPGSISVVVY